MYVNGKVGSGRWVYIFKWIQSICFNLALAFKFNIYIFTISFQILLTTLTTQGIYISYSLDACVIF